MHPDELLDLRGERSGPERLVAAVARSCVFRGTEGRASSGSLGTELAGLWCGPDALGRNANCDAKILISGYR